MASEKSIAILVKAARMVNELLVDLDGHAVCSDLIEVQNQLICNIENYVIDNPKLIRELACLACNGQLDG